MDNRENLIGILGVLLRWKKPIFWLCVIAGIAAVITTLLLPNYYKSTTVYYVASTDLAMPEPVGNRLKEKSLYGTSDDIDRNMTIAQSNEIANYVVDKYNLYEHYDIDTTDRKAAVKVREEFRDLYNVLKTKHDAIELSIEDTDKELAARMINDIREKIVALSRQFLKEGFQQQIVTYETNINTKSQELQVMQDTLQSLRNKYQIYNAFAQSEFISSLLATAQSNLSKSEAKLKKLKSIPSIPRDTINLLMAQVEGFREEVKSNKTSLNLLNQGMSIIVSKEEAFEDAVEQLSLDQQRYKQLKSAATAEPTILFLVENGTVALDKSRPKRSIICIAAVLITLFLGLIAVLLIEQYRTVDWQKLSSDKT